MKTTTTNKTLTATKIAAIIASARKTAAKSGRINSFSHALEQATKGLSNAERLQVALACYAAQKAG